MAAGSATTGEIGVYLGLDLTSSEKRSSAFAILDNQGTLLQWGQRGSDDEIVALAREHRPALVAIDAPLSLPRGLCCLEEGCPCQPGLPLSGRAAERGLSRLGISSFYVTKRTFIKAMVYRGIRLRQALEGLGVEVLEVYPYASKVLLFGRPLPKKQSRAGKEFIRQRLSSRMAMPPTLWGELSHDLADALVAAYTAYLHARGQTQAVGEVGEGLIWVPRRGGTLVAEGRRTGLFTSGQ